MERVKKNKLIQIHLTEEGLNKLDSIRMRLDGISRSEAVREAIRDKFGKLFPPYMARNLQTSPEGIIGIIANSAPITDEQFCESKGGKLGKNNFGIIVFKVGLSSIPINDRKTIEWRAREAGLI